MVGFLLLLGGCVSNQETPKFATPQATLGVKTPKPTFKPKPKPTAVPETPEIATAISRDGRFEATGTLFRAPKLHGTVEVRERKSGRVLSEWKSSDGVTGLSFSPDGNLLAVNQPGELTVWKWATKTRVHREISTETGGWVRITSDFSPDGRWLAFNIDNGTIKVLNVRFWKKRSFAVPMTGNVVFSPDSRFVVASQWDIGVAYSLIYIASEKIREIKGESMGVPLFSTDKKLMVLGVGGIATEIQVWKLPRVRLLRKFPTPIAEDSFFPSSLSPDSRWLLCEDGINHFVVQRLSDGKIVFSSSQTFDSAVWLDGKTLELRGKGKTKRVIF